MKKQLLLTATLAVAIVFNCLTASAQNWTQAGDAITAGSRLGSTNGFPIKFITNNLERMRLDTSGRLVLNYTSPIATLALIKKGSSLPGTVWAPTGTPMFTAFGETNAGNADFIVGMAGNSFNLRPLFMGRRARGTLNAPMAVLNGDQLSSLTASGFDGTNFQIPATVDFFVDGAVAANSVPTRISFVTGTSAADRTERLKVGYTGDFTFNTNQMFLQKSTGYLGVGTAAPIVPFDLNSTSSYLARFDGGANMFLALSEGGTYRGYIGSYAGAAEDVDFGTGSGNTTGKLHMTIQGSPKVTLTPAGNLGIGTTTPTSALHVVGNEYVTGNILANGNLDVNGYVGFGSVERFTDGGSNTIASNSNIVPTADCSRDLGADTLRWNDIWACGSGRFGTTGTTTAPLSVKQTTLNTLTGIGSFQIGETNVTNMAMDNNEIQVRANGVATSMFLQYSGGNLYTNIGGGNVGIGTTSLATGYKLSVNGKIIATEVRVEAFANWPDYVFGRNYNLMSLEELEQKIKATNHLPNIPSAEEVKENGIALGEMQTKTMEKVEENTLYILQLNNKIKELEKKIEALSKLIK